MERFEIEFDEAKRIWTLNERGLDFLDSVQVFQGPYLQFDDNRKDYGEVRHLVFGWLDKRRVVLAWTQRDTRRRIISMRYAHEEEFEAYNGILV